MRPYAQQNQRTAYPSHCVKKAKAYLTPTRRSQCPRKSAGHNSLLDNGFQAVGGSWFKCWVWANLGYKTRKQLNTWSGSVPWTAAPRVLSTRRVGGGGRAVRARRVLEEGNPSLGPGIEDRRDDPPGLLCLVVPDRQGAVPLQDLEQQAPVGWHSLRGESRAELDALQREWGAGAVGVQAKDQAVRVQQQAQHVGWGIIRLERQVGHRPEVHGDLTPLSAQGLAATQHERHASPPPVVHPQRDLGKGFRAARRVDPCLVHVVWDRACSDVARAVAGADGVLLDLLRGEAADGPQDVDLAIAQGALVQGERGLHAHQAEELEQVVLDHVLERPCPVVVGRAPFQGEALVPDDLHPLDVLAVPHLLDKAVGEAQSQDVLHRLEMQEVVDAEDGIFGEGLVQQPVQPLRRGEILAARLLDDDPAPLRHAGAS